MNNSLIELDNNVLCNINGGTFWGVVGGVATCISGTAQVVGASRYLQCLNQ